MRDVERFLFREARLADEHRYAEWEALWTDDGVYWIPANRADSDPDTQMSIVYDNRARISVRVRQLQTGRRHSQAPPSNLRRILGNVELLSPEGPEFDIGANFLICESRERGLTQWAGRCEYRLRRTGDGLRMARKKVVLVDHDRPLSTMSFLV